MVFVVINIEGDLILSAKLLRENSENSLKLEKFSRVCKILDLCSVGILAMINDTIYLIINSRSYILPVK